MLEEVRQDGRSFDSHRIEPLRVETEQLQDRRRDLEIIAPMAAAVTRSVGGMGGRRRAIEVTSSRTLLRA